MRQRANNDIKQEAQEAKIFLWEIASCMGIADFTLSRKLRKELPAGEKAKIREIINRLKAEREGEM